MRTASYDDELISLYKEVRHQLDARIGDFRSIWRARDESAVLSELKFCLLTPQSKALSCWAAIERMGVEGVCCDTPKGAVEGCLKGVRFHRNKASYLLEAMERFEKGDGRIIQLLDGFRSGQEARDWFVRNVKGLGLKEASHFLRNIGYSDDLAILDRHILRNLALAGVIEDVPRSMTRKRYLEIEEVMRDFSNNIGIPLSHLDLLLWYRETGHVFK